MPISERELKDLVAAGVSAAGTAERTAAHFNGAGAEPPRFDLTHTAYYLGALVVMSALGWFLNEAWARYGGWVLTLIAIAYAVAFTVAGESLWRKPGLKQPGGLLFTLAVWMTPLAVFGIQYALGWWPREARASYQEYYPQISGSWVVMEAATIVAAAAALKLRPFPFLTFPLAFALWFLSLDLAALLIGSPGLVAFGQQQLITLPYGARCRATRRPRRAPRGFSGTPRRGSARRRPPRMWPPVRPRHAPPPAGARPSATPRWRAPSAPPS